MRFLFAISLIGIISNCSAVADETTPAPSSPAAVWRAARDAGADQFARGAYEEALTAFGKCLPLAPGPVAQGITSSDIASTLNTLGRNKEALPWFEKALAIWTTMPDRADMFADAALGMADAQRGLGDFRGAEQTLKAGIDVKPTANFASQLRNRFGDMLREQGRNDEARAHFTAALELTGASRMNRIDSLLATADLDRQTMRWEESQANWQRALDMAREENAAEFEALALRGLGMTALNRGDMTQAEAFLKRAVAAFDKAPQLVPQQVANTLHAVAAMYFENGRFTLAEEALDRAFDYIRKDVGEEHPHGARLMITLSRIYSAQSRFEEAKTLAEHAYGIMRASYGDESVGAADALGNVARIEQEARDLPAAAQHFERSLELMRKSPAAKDQRVVALMNGYKEVLKDLHRTREAKKLESEISAFGFR